MNIFLLGATPSFDVTACGTIEQKLARTGGNTGNQLIARGLIHPLVYSKLEWDHTKGPKYVDDNFDVIVIAAANFLFAGFDFSGMADFISRTRLPVVMVGLGAQSNDYSPKIYLKAGTERLIRIVSERTNKIGVRGTFTCDVLSHLGITNTQIVGCPSYYMHGTSMPLTKNYTLPATPNLAINGSRDVLKHAFDRDKMRSVIDNLIAEAIRYDGIFIAQTELEEMILAELPDAPEATNALNRFSTFFANSFIDSTELRHWAKRQTRVFWSVDAWIERMKTIDLVVGTRFHGAMAALIVGKPAFVLCHDTRTSEMSDFLGLPHENIMTINRIDIKEIYSRIDIQAVNGRRSELLEAYKVFLVDNGLKHRF